MKLLVFLFFFKKIDHKDARTDIVESDSDMMKSYAFLKVLLFLYETQSPEKGKVHFAIFFILTHWPPPLKA